MKDLKKRRQRIESKEEKERTKDEEIKRQIKIFQKRAKELEYGLVKTEKGEIMAAKWNGKIIGKYTGPGLPGPTTIRYRHQQVQLGTYGQVGGANSTL